MLSLTHESLHSLNIRSACDERPSCRPGSGSSLSFYSRQVHSRRAETTLWVFETVCLCICVTLWPCSTLRSPSEYILNTLGDFLETAASDRRRLLNFAIEFLKVRFVEFGLGSEARSRYLFADIASSRQVLHYPTHLHF